MNYYLISLLALNLNIYALDREEVHLEVLTDSNKRTIYVFDKDKTQESNCYNDCAIHWPPIKATQSNLKYKETNRIQRKDGIIQLTYKGKPLYYFFKDNAPGDIKGDGLGNVWHVITNPALEIRDR